MRKYGEISFGDKLHLAFVLLKLPFAIAFQFLISPFSSYKWGKTWRRFTVESAYYFLITSLDMNQFQFLSPVSLETYKACMKKAELPTTIEELGEGARLFWIGPKRTDRVLCYFHGGGYALPFTDFTFLFLKHVQTELQKKGIDIGIAVLNYSLIPEHTFPTQLRQATLAVQHLLQDGVKPQNLQLAGDSAGGNLVYAFLAHCLHLADNVPPMKLSAPLGGAYLMSPWVSLTGDDGYTPANIDKDIYPPRVAAEFGTMFYVGIPENQRWYAEPLKAPTTWFKGLDKVVARVLLTSGGCELFVDHIIALEGRMQEYHPQTQIAVEKNGIHCDPIADFLAGEKKLVGLTSLVVNWLATGWSHQRDDPNVGN
ncbi:Alpha/Beta hydrolase protein [Mycena floridula]|nr:Alpha/Beta hydrolase protein [Mycena floridula]